MSHFIPEKKQNTKTSKVSASFAPGNGNFIGYYFKAGRREDKTQHVPTKGYTTHSPPQGKEHKRFSFSDWVHAHPLIYAATVLYLNVNPLQNATADFPVACLHSMHVHYVLYV